MQFGDEEVGEGFVPLEEPFLPSEIAEGADDPIPQGPAEEFPPTDGTPQGETQASDGDPLPEFDPRFRTDFEGLTYIGALTHEFQWAGHQLRIRTLTIEDLLEVGLAQAQYRDTLGDSRAYITAVVAACIVNVDGKPLPQPLTSNPSDTPFSNAFTYVKSQWYPWTADAVYQEFTKLEARVDEVIKAMGKASPSARSTRG